MNEIIPAILAPDEQTFRLRLKVAEKLAPVIQVDVLDNRFAPNTSWCDMALLKTLDTPIGLELHLMVSDPARWLEAARGALAVRRAIWHIEAPADHAELLMLCEDLGIEGGLAISPRTPLEAFRPLAEMVKEVLVLGVEPGWSGQTLIPEMVQKVRDIRSNWPDLIIGFDGGVTTENIPELRGAGVTRFYAASAIFGAKDPIVAMKALQEA